MDLWQLTLIVLRRWYVFLPLCVLTAFAVVRAGESVNVEYQAQTTVMLVGPSQVAPQVPDQPIRTNPYLNQGLITTGAAMQAVMSSEPVRQRMVEEGGTAGYVVTASNRNPLITVDITAGSAERARVTAETFPELLAEELDTVQDRVDAPSSQRVAVDPLAVGQTPIAVQEGLRKAQAVAAGLGLALAVGAALLLEALMVFLRRRRLQAASRRRERAFTEALRDQSTQPAQSTQSAQSPQPTRAAGQQDTEKTSGERRTGSVASRTEPPVGSLRD